MSTRCNIILISEGKKVQFYHHWDGYPEGVGMMLCCWFATTAWMTPWCSNEDERKRNHFSMFRNCIKGDRAYEDEGEEISLHGDIEFLYYVDFDNSKITYNEVPFDLHDSENLERLGNLNEGEYELDIDLVNSKDKE